MANVSSYDDDNILKRIIRKELPCHLVYENDQVTIFMDIMPQSKGHTLVVPKIADTDLITSSEATAVECIKWVRKVAQAALPAFGAAGVVINQFNRSSAGQTIFHLHFHVIPVYDNEVIRSHAREKQDAEVLAAHAKLLQASLLALL